MIENINNGITLSLFNNRLPVCTKSLVIFTFRVLKPVSLKILFVHLRPSIYLTRTHFVIEFPYIVDPVICKILIRPPCQYHVVI